VTAYTIGQSLLAPVLPTLESELHTSEADVTWVLTCYLLSAAVCTPIFGRLGDARGKKRMLVAALSVLTVGSFMAALATSLPAMLAARAVQGAGGGVLPLSFGIVRDEVPPAEVPGTIGVISALSGVGSGLGIVLAGPIVEHLGYHWLFWMPAVVTAAAALGAWLLVPESPVTSPSKINWAAALLLSCWLVALLLAVSQAPQWGWLAPRVLGLIALAAVGAVVWTRAEARSPHPLIDMAVMRLRSVWTNNAVAFGLGVIMYVSFSFVPIFVQTPPSADYGLGVSVTQAGLMVLPQTMSVFVMASLAAPLARRFGAKTLLVSAPLFAVAAFTLLAFAHQHAWQIYLATGVLGIGVGLAFSTSSSLLAAAVPARHTGAALGMNANIRVVGGAIGSAAMTSVILVGAAPGKPPLESGWSHGFEMLATVSALCVVAAALVPAANRPSSRLLLPARLRTWYVRAEPHARLRSGRPR
jgi:EmrB/QacA subfamily drug resistance transporter